MSLYFWKQGLLITYSWKLVIVDHFTCHSDASFLSILWLYACMLLSALTHAKIHSADFSYENAVFGCHRFDFLCNQEPKPLTTHWLNLTFTMMISLLMVHTEFLHVVFIVCSLQIHVCLQAYEILILDRMVLFVLNLLSIIYICILETYTGPSSSTAHMIYAVSLFNPLHHVTEHMQHPLQKYIMYIW